MRNIIICHALAATTSRRATLGIGDGFVVVLGVLGYDVPGVDETGDVTQHAEKDVNEGVGGAKT